MPLRGCQNNNLNGRRTVFTTQHDLTGMKVRNDGFSLREILNAHYQLVDLQYIGDFEFIAECEDGSYIRISTLPTDETQNTIQIVKVTHIR